MVHRYYDDRITKLFIREHCGILEDNMNDKPSLLPRGFSGAMDVNSVL